MDEQFKKLNKSIKANRVFGVFTMLFSLATLILILICFIRINNFIKVSEPAMKVIAEIDADQLNKTIANINKLTDTLHFEDIMDTLDKLRLDEMSDLLDKLNVDNLNTTLQNLNSATEALQNLKKKLDPLLGIFGGGN